jgi:hypothetical protein
MGGSICLTGADSGCWGAQDLTPLLGCVSTPSTVCQPRSSSLEAVRHPQARVAAMVHIAGCRGGREGAAVQSVRLSHVGCFECVTALCAVS